MDAKTYALVIHKCDRSTQINGKTGQFLGVFASDNNNGQGSQNGLNGPNGLLFGKDCSLYVATEGTANDADGNLVFPYSSQVLRYSPAQVAGKKPTTTPSVFISQPNPLAESFGFVSLLGLALAPNDDILVSDFAGGGLIPPPNFTIDAPVTVKELDGTTLIKQYQIQPSEIQQNVSLTSTCS